MAKAEDEIFSRLDVQKIRFVVEVGRHGLNCVLLDLFSAVVREPRIDSSKKDY